MEKKIVVEINEDTGEILIETHNFKGKSCIDESQWVKDIIGDEKARHLKACYFVNEKQHVKKHLNICG